MDTNHWSDSCLDPYMPGFDINLTRTRIYVLFDESPASTTISLKHCSKICQDPISKIYIRLRI